jgi:hypothetical protein
MRQQDTINLLEIEVQQQPQQPLLGGQEARLEVEALEEAIPATSPLH